jgi:phenylalanine-4-hydroxylase
MPKPIPRHLKKYIVKQDYSRYTPEDQAVWRFTMRILRSHLDRHAHSSYRKGLQRTGLDKDQIPKISELDRKLRRFGWGAVAVSGFIPPAAFMEFQSLGYLPIATELRTVDHLNYTPAPDIVHEAAGHAPFVVDPTYARYLKQYAEVAAKSIISHEDMDLYLAIRELSDAKEDPASTPEQIERLNTSVVRCAANIETVSEAGLLSRMNWWTAEYGLVGSVQRPRIFGAGLLSSPGEARSCLSKNVKKIPLSLKCLDYSYDITERQPQLFVTPNFSYLSKLLRNLERTMSFRRGGVHGLDQALLARTVNTIELDTGLQISGVLDQFMGETFFKTRGPTQIAFNGRQLPGHGINHHAHGYSTPLGQVMDIARCPSRWSPREMKKRGLVKGRSVTLRFVSGFKLTGTFTKDLRRGDRSLLWTFSECTITNQDQTYFEPSWGAFDLALGQKVTSVFGGPADRRQFDIEKDFASKRIVKKSIPPADKRRHDLYTELRSATADKIAKLWPVIRENHSRHWLLFFEAWLAAAGLPIQGEIEKALIEHSAFQGRESPLQFAMRPSSSRKLSRKHL